MKEVTNVSVDEQDQFMRKLLSHYAVHDLNVDERLLQEGTLVHTLGITTFSDHTMLFENIIVV